MTQPTPTDGLTKEQAERICEEAEFQGWGQRDAPYTFEGGRVEMRQWYTNRRWNEDRTDMLPPEPIGRYSVDLKFPGSLGPEYSVRTTEEWRKLKAKVDEIRQIVDEVREYGWAMQTRGGDGQPAVNKSAKFGMYVEVYPPGTRPPYGVRVGGMRTWRKLIREYTPIEGSLAPQELDAPS